MAQQGNPKNDMRFGIGIDGTAELGNTLDKLTRQFKQAESAMKANMKAFDGAGDSVEALGKHYEDLTNVVKIQEKRIDVLNKRREDAIKKYGEESKQVEKLNAQINSQTAKYNQLQSQLQKTSKEYINAQSGVTQLTKEIRECERETAQQVKALKDAGDATGAFEAKQSGLRKQFDLTEKAVEAQKRAVQMMAKEFGESSKEVTQAKNDLAKLEGQSKLASKALKSMENVDLKSVGQEAQSASGGVGELLGGLTSLGGSAVTAAIGSVVGAVAGITSGVNEAKDAINGFVGDLGVATDGAVVLSKRANELVKIGLVDNLQEAQEALAQTQQLAKKAIMGGEDDMMIAQLAVGYSKQFDTDIQETLRGATAMAENFGISVAEAFDLLTAGAQNGLNAQGDLADQMAEYSQVLGQAGFTGSEAFTMMFNGMQNGAYQVDKVNDLIKEMSISVTDGRLADNMDMFSDSTRNMFNEFKAGRATQAQVVQSMIGDFAKMEGQYGALNKASTVWSALGEDNSLKVIKSLQLTSNEFEETAGKAWDAVTANSNTSAFETIASEFKGLVNEIGLELAPMLGQFNEQISGVFEKATPHIINGLKTILGYVKPALKVLGDFGSGLWDVFKMIWETLYPKLKPILDMIWKACNEIFTELQDFWNQYGKQIMTAFQNFLEFISPLLDFVIAMVKDFVEHVIGFVKGMLDVIQGLIKTFTGIFTGDWELMWEGIKQAFSGAIKAIWEWFNILFYQKLVKGIKSLASGFTTTVQNMWTTVKNWFTQTPSQIWNGIKTWISNLLTKTGELKSRMVDTVKSLWDTIKTTFSNGKDTILKWITELPGKMAEGISKGAKGIANAFIKVFNKAIDGINGAVGFIMDGLDWVFDKLGMEKLGRPKFTKMNYYAKGTDGHRGGHAVVNDGRGAELVQMPNGQAFIPRGKNVFIPHMPKGTRVFTAEQTASMFGKNTPTFHYKNGVGNLIGKGWDWLKGTANKVKNVVSDVWDYATNPAKLFDKIVEGVFDGMGGLPLKVMKGFVSKIKDSVIGMFESSMAVGGDISTDNAHGVYQYLLDIANHAIKKFGNLTITSGYRAGDPHDHGKRNAIDIALPSSMNGSPLYTEMANYLYKRFPHQISYIIANNRVKDRSGKSGTGVHDNWTNWAEGGHLNHIHISGFGDAVGGGAGESMGGSGVERWRSIAAKALRMTGDYTPANLNALLRRMNQESGGNPRAINNWDINAKNGTPSKGLMQVIDPTFRAYARAPYNRNIYDPLSNILASINYTKRRYGSLIAGWGRIGGYENGGFINKHQIAQLGEGNKPEMVVPLSNKSRAIALLARAGQLMGVNPASATTQGSGGDISMLVALMQQQNELLQAILDKPNAVAYDSKRLARDVEPHLDAIQNRKQMQANRRNKGRF